MTYPWTEVGEGSQKSTLCFSDWTWHTQKSSEISTSVSRAVNSAGTCCGLGRTKIGDSNCCNRCSGNLRTIGLPYQSEARDHRGNPGAPRITESLFKYFDSLHSGFQGVSLPYHALVKPHIGWVTFLHSPDVAAQIRCHHRSWMISVLMHASVCVLFLLHWST